MTRIELNSTIWYCSLVKSFPHSPCTNMSVHMHNSCVCIIHQCGGPKDDPGRYSSDTFHTFSPLSSFLSFFWGGRYWGRGTCKPLTEAHWIGEAVWPAGPCLCLPKAEITSVCHCAWVPPPPSLFCFVMFLNIGSEDQTQVTLARSLPSPSRAFLMFLYPVRKDMELDCAWIFLWVQYQLYRLPIN